MSKFFEEIDIGTVFDLGTFTFTRENIIDFAKSYDFQPFHIDEGAANASLFEGLCASGWQTAVVWASLLSHYWENESDTQRKLGLDAAKLGPSPGFKDLKWLKPVRPDMALHYTATVEAKRPMNTHPEWGLVTLLAEAKTADGTLMMSFSNHVFVERQVL